MPRNHGEKNEQRRDENMNQQNVQMHNRGETAHGTLGQCKNSPVLDILYHPMILFV